MTQSEGWYDEDDDASSIDGACDRLDKLPSFKNNRATDTLEFFNQLRAIWLDLNYLDEAFPDPQQPPSSAILCTCNMKKLRGKLNHDVDTQLVNFILNEGKYCAPKTEFGFLMRLADVACNKAHLSLASAGPSKPDQPQGKHKSQTADASASWSSTRYSAKSPPSSITGLWCSVPKSETPSHPPHCP